MNSATSWELQRKITTEIYVEKFVWGTQYTYRYKLYDFIVFVGKGT